MEVDVFKLAGIAERFRFRKAIVSFALIAKGLFLDPLLCAELCLCYVGRSLLYYKQDGLKKSQDGKQAPAPMEADACFYAQEATNFIPIPWEAVQPWDASSASLS